MPAAAPTAVLLHSPLTTSVAWGALPALLGARGLAAVAPEVAGDEEPPYAARWVAHAALAVAAAVPAGQPVVLVAHSGAGPLLPRLAAACRAGGRPVTAYAFLDAMLPPAPTVGAPSRMDLLRAEDAELAETLHEALHAGDRFPAWSDEDLAAHVPDPVARAALLRGLRPRGHDFFTEPLPVARDWPDAPCGYLRTSPAYAFWGRSARARGWPVAEHPAGHFAALADAGGTADALAALLERCGVPAARP